MAKEALTQASTTQIVKRTFSSIEPQHIVTAIQIVSQLIDYFGNRKKAQREMSEAAVFRKGVLNKRRKVRSAARQEITPAQRRKLKRKLEELDELLDD